MKKRFKLVTLPVLTFLTLSTLSIQVQKIDYHDSNKAFSNSQETQLNLFRWQKDVHDNKKLWQLSIPGTHDSGMFDGSGFAYFFGQNYAKTQSKNWLTQLKQGIRFFDLRIDRSLDIRHGLTYSTENLEKAFDAYVTFLKSNPTEFIILRIKDEDGSITHREENWENKYLNFLRQEKYKNFLFQNTEKNNWINPSVKDLRGKIFIFNHLHHLISTNFENGLLYNNPSRNVWQDNYDSSESDKFNAFIKHLKGYAKINQNQPYIDLPNYSFNYLNRANGEKIQDTASSLNLKLLEHLNNESADINQLGFVIMDFPGDSLVLRIIKSNYFISEYDLNNNLLGTWNNKEKISIKEIYKNKIIFDNLDSNLEIFANLTINNELIENLKIKNNELILNNFDLKLNDELKINLYRLTPENIYFNRKKIDELNLFTTILNLNDNKNDLSINEESNENKSNQDKDEEINIQDQEIEKNNDSSNKDISHDSKNNQRYWWFVLIPIVFFIFLSIFLAKKIKKTKKKN